MLDLYAICRGRTYFWRSLLFFDAWFWRYLSWPEVLLQVIALLRSRLWTLFVVFQSTWSFYCLHSMLDSDAICRGRTNFWRSLLFFDAWLSRYLSWPEVLLKVIARLRCLILSIYAVFQSTWLFYCLSSKLDFAAICRGRKYFWKSLLFFDAWFWCYLSWPDILLEVIAFLRCLILMVFVVAGGTLTSHCSGAADFQSKKCIIKTNVDVKFTTCGRHVSYW